MKTTNHSTFATKAAIYVTIATVIFSHARRTCHFHVRRNFTWFLIVLFIIRSFYFFTFWFQFSSIDLNINAHCVCFYSIKGHTSSPTSVATVSISTSAVTTTTNRDLHITPENPFGVIGEVATATTAFQSTFSVFLESFHF